MLSVSASSVNAADNKTLDLTTSPRFDADNTSTPPEAPAMSVEQNKAIIRRLFDIFGSHDLSELDQVCDEDIVYRTPEVGEVRGLDVYREVIHEAIDTFPDLDPALQEMMGEGDRINAVHVARGTHESDYDGIPPSGRRMELVVSDIFTLRGGKVVEHREFYDVLTILRQLGAASDELRPGGEEWPRQGTRLRPQ